MSKVDITGDLGPLKICANLKVLYVYDNKLTSLRGIDRLRRLTHLYAQHNELEDLEEFSAPPSLEHLYLEGNALTVLSGLHEAGGLRELKLAGQRRAKPVEAAAAAALTSSADVQAMPELPMSQLVFEQASLWTVASALQALDVSSCGLTDEGVEPLVVLRALRTLNLSSNVIASVERLQQLLLRLPRLTHLKVAQNPLLQAFKCRERIILAGEALEDLDGRAVKPQEKLFLQRLSKRQVSASAARPATETRAVRAGDGEYPGGAQEGRRPVSIDSRRSHALPTWDGVDCARAPGLESPASHGRAMPGGQKKPDALPGTFQPVYPRSL